MPIVELSGNENEDWGTIKVSEEQLKVIEYLQEQGAILYSFPKSNKKKKKKIKEI